MKITIVAKIEKSNLTTHFCTCSMMTAILTQTNKFKTIL